MNAKNLKIVALSATPSMSDPFDLSLLFNMLRGYMTIPGDKRKYTLFPDDSKKFDQYFIDYKTNSMKNKSIFQERIMGLVSYFKTFTLFRPLSLLSRSFASNHGPIS